jgi:hypothetical protein
MDLLRHGAQLDGHAGRAGREARVPAGQGQRQRVPVKAAGPGLGPGMARAVVKAAGPGLGLGLGMAGAVVKAAGAGLGLGMARGVVRAVPMGPHARWAPR